MTEPGNQHQDIHIDSTRDQLIIETALEVQVNISIALDDLETEDGQEVVRNLMEQIGQAAAQVDDSTPDRVRHLAKISRWSEEIRRAWEEQPEAARTERLRDELESMLTTGW